MIFFLTIYGKPDPFLIKNRDFHIIFYILGHVRLTRK